MPELTARPNLVLIITDQERAERLAAKLAEVEDRLARPVVRPGGVNPAERDR